MGVYDKGKAGSVVETEQQIVDKETGEVYTKAVGSGFYVGQGNWGGPKGGFGRNLGILCENGVTDWIAMQDPALSTTPLLRARLLMRFTSSRRLR